MMNFDEFEEKIKQVNQRETEAIQRFMAAAKSHAIAKRPGNTVIYVEDDPSQISLVKTLLAAYCDLRLFPARTLDDAKALIERKANRLKCVILDIMLGGMPADDIKRAIEMIRWIKNKLGPEFPILLMSSNTEYIQKVLACVELPVESYVKGQPMHDLVKIVKELGTEESDNVICQDTADYAAEGPAGVSDDERSGGDVHSRAAG